MDYISSKNIFYLFRDTLKLIDPKPINHGIRVAYLVYKMLQVKGGYEEYELADNVFFTMLHDIGFYKTGGINDMLRLESTEYMPHSIYGYLFLKYLSPMEENAKILLYHHSDCEQLEESDILDKTFAACLILADKVDLYQKMLGLRFDPTSFQKYSDVRYTKEALILLYQAMKKYNVMEKLRDGSYMEELEDLSEFLIFNNEDKRRFLETLMYCTGFWSEQAVVDTVICCCISEEIGKKLLLGTKELDWLYYGSLLHDIGMLAIPRKVVEVPRILTKEEMIMIQKHVKLEESILRERFRDKEIVEVAIAHHERADGSGYPAHLRDCDMDRLQRILQLSDAAAAMMGKRNYRMDRTREEIIQILVEEEKNGKYNKEVVDTLIIFYDQIIEKSKEQAKRILETRTRMYKQYMRIYNNMTAKEKGTYGNI